MKTPPKDNAERKTRYYELRDDGLSVDGAHPVRGDIVAAKYEEGANGELHLIEVSGRVVIGHLYRNKNSLTLKFPNTNFAAAHYPLAAVDEVLRVVRFFHAQDPLPQAAAKKARRTRRTQTGPVINLLKWKQQHPRSVAR